MFFFNCNISYFISVRVKLLIMCSVRWRATLLMNSNYSTDRVQSQEPTVNSSMDVQPAASATEATPCDTLVSTSDAEPSSRAQVKLIHTNSLY